MMKQKRKRLNSKSARELRSSLKSKPSFPPCTIIQVEDDEEEEQNGNAKDDNKPLRPIFCLKNTVDLKRFDETEDCYVLDFDPFDSLNRRLSFSKDLVSDSDLSLVAEKGQVACRDYPHARSLCLKFPFHTTPHQSYCQLCYCYVCDAVAPCDEWPVHCNASHTDQFWKVERRKQQKQQIKQQLSSSNSALPFQIPF